MPDTDKDFRDQVDEYHVDRELADIREAIIDNVVDRLDARGHDPGCACHEWHRWEFMRLRRRERLLRKMARLTVDDE